MNRPVDDGAGGKVPYRVHIEALARRGDLDALSELAAQPKLPKGSAHLWRHYQDIASTRQSNGFSHNPLSREEVHRWEDDEAVRLSYWERRAIFRIDQIYRASLNGPPEGPATEE